MLQGNTHSSVSQSNEHIPFMGPGNFNFLLILIYDSNNQESTKHMNDVGYYISCTSQRKLKK